MSKTYHTLKKLRRQFFAGLITKEVLEKEAERLSRVKTKLLKEGEKSHEQLPGMRN